MLGRQERGVEISRERAREAQPLKREESCPPRQQVHERLRSTGGAAEVGVHWCVQCAQPIVPIVLLLET